MLEVLIVNKDKCVLYVWYDNEFGYTAQLLGLAKEMVGLTYERYLLDYKINVKQLNSSQHSLNSLIESKKKNNPELDDIYYYYMIPEWINLNSDVKFIK